MSCKYLLGDCLSALYNKDCFYDVPVYVKYSSLCVGVLHEMQLFGYINKFEVVENNNKKGINILLRTVNGSKTINSFKLISKPSCRVYRNVSELKKMFVYNPYSLVVISTSQGILSIDKAIKLGVGGEVLCEIF